MPIRIHCRDCGSENVGRDAWALWDVREQDWQVGPVFDHAYCFDCDKEARLVERESIGLRGHFQ
jgi:hypothetical protein